jgi:hypothetical protein
MGLTGNEPHDITLAEAALMTKNFRDTIVAGQTIAHAFGKKAIQDILDQVGCTGIRLYYGLENGIPQIIVTGLNASGEDLYQGLLAERSVRCPQSCSPSNPLNSNIVAGGI